ncbi:unnamed protein product [Arabis nemorensis]|uniref:Uncharacterized protein n=1 Tax=Arabis nemorensis TaxID=586526 RepID=A0A565B1R6_9BRAS|nr:unnamed protein product [Arabis nemorensis]
MFPLLFRICLQHKLSIPIILFGERLFLQLLLTVLKEEAQTDLRLIPLIKSSSTWFLTELKSRAYSLLCVEEQTYVNCPGSNFFHPWSNAPESYAIDASETFFSSFPPAPLSVISSSSLYYMIFMEDEVQHLGPFFQKR